MPVKFYLKLTRNYLNPYYLKVLIKLHQDCEEYTNQLADCWSPLGGQKDTTKLPKLHVHQITNQLSARSDSFNEMRIATQEDDEIALLKHTITQG